MRRVRRYRTNTRYGRAVFGEAWLHECPHCGLVQAVPRPALQALADYYARDYRREGYAGSDVADLSTFPKDNLFYFNRGQSVAELLSLYVQKDNPHILDIGAGYGHVLYALGQRYPNSARSAIECSEMCVRCLKSMGVQVFTRPVEEILPRMARQFDLVVATHVLEHLLDPREVLRLIHSRLAPGGALCIEVPNIPAESLLGYPNHVWTPRFDEPHITFFSRSALCDLLESVGFDLQFCDTAGPEYKYISPLRFRLPPVRSFLQGLLPTSLFFFLRRQRFTQSFRVQEREESFYRYGGFRIWTRSVSRKRLNADRDAPN